MIFLVWICMSVCFILGFILGANKRPSEYVRLYIIRDIGKLPDKIMTIDGMFSEQIRN